ncbi:MAG: hypothetical protein RR214_01780 [Synergistaceae bacterium]
MTNTNDTPKTTTDKSFLTKAEELSLMTDWIINAERQIRRLKYANDMCRSECNNPFALYTYDVNKTVIDEMSASADVIKANIERGEIPVDEMAEKMSKYTDGVVFLREFADVCLTHADANFDSPARHSYRDFRTVVRSEEVTALEQIRLSVYKRQSGSAEYDPELFDEMDKTFSRYYD